MPMSHNVNNVRAAALRAEFQNDSGEVSLSKYKRGSNNYDGVRAPGNNTATAFTSNNELPFHATGAVWNSLVTSYSTNSSPAKTKQVTSNSNISMGNLRGIGNMPFAVTSNANSTSVNPSADDSGATANLTGVGNFKSGQEVQSYESGMGASALAINSNNPMYALANAQRAPNAWNYEDLQTHAAPGDIMFFMAFTSSGGTPSSYMYPAWNQSSAQHNTSAPLIGSFAFEYYNGNNAADGWVVTFARVCKGGERFCAHRLNYSSGAHNILTGIIRSPGTSTTNTSGKGVNTTVIARQHNDYGTDSYTMGAAWGQGEVVVMANLTPFASYASNSVAGTSAGTSRYMKSGAGSQISYHIALGSYEETASVGFKGNGWTPNATRSIKVSASGGHTSSGEEATIIMKFALGA